MRAGCCRSTTSRALAPSGTAKAEIDLEQVALTLGEVSRRSAGTDDETPEDQTPETDINDIVQNSLTALRTLRDEIRVDLNLAGKEVRDRWRRLEARLRAAETHAHEARRDAARNLTGVVDSATAVPQPLAREDVAARTTPLTGGPGTAPRASVFLVHVIEDPPVDVPAMATEPRCPYRDIQRSAVTRVAFPTRRPRKPLGRAPLPCRWDIGYDCR